MSVLKNIGQACLNPVALIGFGFLSWIWRHDYVMQGDPVGELLAFPFWYAAIVAAAYRRGESERKEEERQRVEAEEYQALVRAWRSLFKG